ncbi:MAG TPA: hypothetical protein VGM92_00835 [Candidatus Kapabacteria bacterium]
MADRFFKALRKIIEFVSQHLRKNAEAARPFMTPVFARQLQEVEANDSMAAKNFCRVLSADPAKPKRGRNVEGTRCHKTGMAKGNHSGMYRILYYHSIVRNEVYFILLFAKADQENLTADQMKELSGQRRESMAGRFRLLRFFQNPMNRFFGGFSIDLEDVSLV